MPPFAAHDDLLLELALLGKKDRDKQTETEKRKSYHKNIEEKSQKARDE